MLKSSLRKVAVIATFLCLLNSFAEAQIANAGFDQSICASSVFLLGNDPTPGVGAWTTTGNGIFTNPTQFDTEITNLDSGENILRWTVTLGDVSVFDEVIITNNQNPAVANVAGPTSICVDHTFLLGNIPIAGNTGYWSLLGGMGDIQNPSSHNSEITNLIRGVTSLSWTIDNDGCLNYDNVDITNNSAIVNAGVDFMVCSGPIHLYAVDPYPATGEWAIVAGGGTIVDPTMYSTLVSDITTGVITFSWTVTNQICTDTDNVTVTNTQVFANAGTDQTLIYPTNSTTMNATLPAGAIGIWTIVGGGAIIENSNDPNTLVTNLSQGLIFLNWRVIQNDCYDSENVTILVEGFNECNVGLNQIISVDSTQMEATLPPLAGASGEWQVVSGGATIDDYNDPHTWIRNVNIGVNTLSWQVTANGFMESCDVNITYIPLSINQIEQNNFNIISKQNSIEITSSKNVSSSLVLEICNLSGQIVYSEHIKNTNENFKREILTNNYPAGMYFVRISGNKINIAKKIVIKK